MVDIAKLYELIKLLCFQKWFGKLELTFDNGRIVHLKKIEALTELK